MKHYLKILKLISGKTIEESLEIISEYCNRINRDSNNIRISLSYNNTLEIRNIDGMYDKPKYKFDLSNYLDLAKIRENKIIEILNEE